MKKALPIFAALLWMALPVAGQTTTEWHFSPDASTDLTAAFPVYSHNGARGLSGPWDLDRDGKMEILVAQHDASGGAVHVLESAGLNTWEHVYSTALIDSSSSSSNTRYASAGDLDGDGNWEIIYVAGNGYKEDPVLGHGVYVWEHDGVEGSDNYGTYPATVGRMYDLDGLGAPSFVYAQNMDVIDIDGDGQHEVLLPPNGPSSHDVFYVLSVSGTFEMNGAGSGFETWVIEGREAPRTRDTGGGSPFELIAADMNGDGFMDLSFHTWNNLNFFNWTTNGADTYLPNPDGQYFKASDGDDVALFGGVAADIDGDGNDEVFYPDFMTKALTVIDYDDFEDVTSISADNVAWNAVDIGGAGGVAAGDLDGDGAPEIIVGGPGYSLSARNNGAPSEYIRIAEFNGGDPKDGNSWFTYSVETASPLDTLGFNTVMRDSAGVMSSYLEMAASKQGSTGSGDDPIFPSGIAFLGDVDGDDDVEIAISFQGVDDSLYTYKEIWNADSLRYDRTIMDRMATPERAFVRIVSMDGLAVTTEDNRLILPSDYKLSANYPNPFNPTTSFDFTLPIDKTVSVRVYDIAGRLVKTLVNGQAYAAGTYQVTWDGTSDGGSQVASGTYLYTLEYGNFRQSRTMVLLK